MENNLEVLSDQKIEILDKLVENEFNGTSSRVRIFRDPFNFVTTVSYRVVRKEHYRPDLMLNISYDHIERDVYIKIANSTERYLYLEPKWREILEGN